MTSVWPCAVCRNRIWYISMQKAECRKGHEINGQFYVENRPGSCPSFILGIQEIRP